MKFQSLLLLLIVLIPGCEKKEKSYSYLETRVLEEMNAHRESLGLTTLTMNRYIWEKAREHSHNMARGLVTFSHEGFDQRFDDIKNSLTRVTSGAENILFGADTPEAAVQSWLNSEGHKNNIEGDYTITGIGTAEDIEGRLFYTQIFIKTLE